MGQEKVNAVLCGATGQEGNLKYLPEYYRKVTIK
jgi:hypothetical protein